MSGKCLAVGIGRTVEAVAFTREAGTARRRWLAVGAGRRARALCAAGADVIVISRSGLPPDADLPRLPADSPGRLLLSLPGAPGLLAAGPDGPRPLRPPAGCPGEPDVMRQILAVLAGRGVGPGLLLLVGTQFRAADGTPGADAALLIPEATRVTAVSVGAEPAAPDGVTRLGGGSKSLLALLDEQLRRRAHRRVPEIDEDPAWIIAEAGDDPARRRVTESLFTLGAAGLATRGCVEEPVPGAQPLVLAAGVYTGTGPDQHLLPGPVWTGLGISPVPDADRRVLDLRTGVLARTELSAPDHPLRTLRLASIAAPGVVAMRAEAGDGRLEPAGAPLRQPPGAVTATGRQGRAHWAWTDAEAGGGIGAAAVQHSERHGGTRVVQRIAAYSASRTGPPDLRAATARLQAAADAGFDRLLAEQRAAWAARWDAVDASVRGDPDTQLRLRFALFQLWCAIKDRGELAAGARGLSGTGYAGHVFWDADVFMFPAVASIDPAAATAMIRYRMRRLDAARARARAAGRRGARFPWESAAGGEDVTPAAARLGGRVIPVLTGPLEEHITADVAWAVAYYARWSGRPPGHLATLLAETARYWASRCRVDEAGQAHIDQVIGPDEYHERVDDNAYTNVMARWNLRAAAACARASPGGADGSPGEAEEWRELAARLADGYDRATGRYEQFAGYFDLEPLLIGDVATPPVAADLLLGRERVAKSQLIKQPDVLMLHHLVPDEVEPGSLGPNLDFYGPRTAHGSSLSPAVTASLLARAGRPDEALAMLRTALRLDLDDLTGMTATGLHMANLGAIWQAVLAGFAGVRVDGGMLTVDPRLPAAWDGLELRFRCLGRKVRLDITRDRTEISADRPLLAGLAGQRPRWVTGTACFRAAPPGSPEGGRHDQGNGR